MPSKVQIAAALGELCRGLEGLSSCFNLVPPAGRPLRERLGLELAHVETHRAWRVAQSLRLLLDEPPLTRRPVNVAELLRRVVEDLQDELRLARIRLTVGSTNSLPAVWADGPLLTAGLSTMFGGLIATLETAPAAALHATAATGEGSVVLRFQSEGAAGLGDISRLFDLESADRPGSVAAAISLAAARRVLQLQGHVEAIVQQSGEFVISLTLPVRS